MNLKLKILIPVFLLMLSFGLFAQKASKGKVVYKYRKFEKFDFSGIELSGGPDSIGDLSITPRAQKRFKNRLPLRKNFNPELRESIETLR
jgi:hypothetical protein